MAVHIVDLGCMADELIKQQIGRVVMHNGCLVMPENTDSKTWEEYSQIAAPYKAKYNPNNLSPEEYREQRRF